MIGMLRMALNYRTLSRTAINNRRSVQNRDNEGSRIEKSSFTYKKQLFKDADSALIQAQKNVIPLI